jgi:uncharacterized protein involved in cysteine biosynthesis
VFRELGLALLSPLRGLWILVRHPGLVPYALPPLALGVFWSLLFALQRFALPELPAGEQWYLEALRWFVDAVLSASVVMIQVLIALSAPLLDWLGEQTEEALGVRPRGPGFFRELLTLTFVRRGLHSLVEALKLLGFKLLIYAFALPLALVPVAGPPLSSLLSGIATGVDFLDYPLARRHHRLQTKLAWARQHWAATLCFGLSVFGLLSVPVLAALALPACVVGGTDLVFRLGPPPRRVKPGGTAERAT